jgi:hypothetical protein
MSISEATAASNKRLTDAHRHQDGTAWEAAAGVDSVSE